MNPTLALIGIVVQDMAASLAFYRDLGLEIAAENDTAGHVEITLPNGLRFAWDTVEVIHSFDPDWQPPTGGHQVAFAFLCESAAAVDGTFQRLVDKGYRVHKSPFDAAWGQRYAQILDPDGNVIDLFAPLV